MCTAGAPRPPRAAGTWAAAGGGGHAGPSRSVAQSERPARRGPWPCAPRAPRAPACWRSCCARAGGHWPRSPPSRATGVRAAACASAPRCAACICCWRPCPPWRRRPPSCESGGARGTWARGAAGGRGEGRAVAPLSSVAGRGADLSAARAASGAAFVRSSASPRDGKVVGSRRGKPPALPGPVLLAPLLRSPSSRSRPSPAPSSPGARLPPPPASSPPPSFPLSLFPPPSTRRFPLPVFPSSPSAAPPSRLWGRGRGPPWRTLRDLTSPHLPGRREPPARLVPGPVGRTVLWGFLRAVS